MAILPATAGHQFLRASLVLMFIKCTVFVQAQGDSDFLSLNSKSDMESSAADDYPSNEVLTDQKIEELSSFLTKLLLVPWPNGASPLLYVEKSPNDVFREDLRDEIFDEIEPSKIEDDQEMRPASPKRSRYYRKYPWKRQNNRYEPSYVCTPKKDDVFRLLVALHGERNGKRGQLVDFCNRKRPASLVFTNIRFIG